VLNDENEALLIFRRGKWDLPKGKLDKGETLEECAVREVMEETGLNSVQLISALTITFHTYHQGTKFILKESHWYTMKAASEQTLVPQTTEDITEIRWVKKEELKDYFENAYPSVVDVLKDHLKMR